VSDERLTTVLTARLREPGAFARAASNRTVPASLFNTYGKMMGDRLDLLDRLCVALARPGVNGVLGTPDIIEDLLLLGVLEDKVVFGSMNRGGLAGSVVELDDRFTACDAAAISALRLQGGKMLTRIDAGDPATVATIVACANAVNELAEGA
jgi:hypothetical protein